MRIYPLLFQCLSYRIENRYYRGLSHRYHKKEEINMTKYDKRYFHLCVQILVCKHEWKMFKVIRMDY